MRRLSPPQMILAVSVALTASLFTYDAMYDNGSGDPLEVIVLVGAIYTSLFFLVFMGFFYGGKKVLRRAKINRAH